MARKYRRAKDGKFSGSRGGVATTVGQDKPGHTALRKKLKKKLSGGKAAKATGGALRLKVKGTKTQTKAQKLARQRSRKRFG